jgi:cytochrome c peroxidase
MHLFFKLLPLLLIGCSLTASATSEPITPIPTAIINNPEEIELGRMLFNDVRLSKDNRLSCASCHSLTKFGGADGQQFSTGANGQKGTLNSPSIFNVSLNFRQFWDGRAASLLEQIDGPISNPIEMASSWNEIISKLIKDDFYLKLFNQIYPDGLTANNIKTAIIDFEESLLTPNSRFDQYLRGQKKAISEDELEGYQLFKQYGCISCHQGAAIGGKMYQKFGVLIDYLKSKQQLTKADFGRFNVTKNEKDRFVFKVPSLRNVALTAPYFHDGSVNNLTEAVNIMVRYQLGRIKNPAEINKIVLFLRTLTGEYLGRPLIQESFEQ